MHPRLAVLALACSLALAADAQQPAPAPTPTSLTSQAGTIRVERLASLEEPWGTAYLPDGRLLVTEKPGRLRIFARGALSAPVGGLPAIAYRGQGGLLDVAVDPDFARNRFVYLSFTEAAEQQPAGARETGDPRFGTFIDTTDVQLKGGAVARGRLEGNALTDVRVIWRQTPKFIGRGHFGGHLAFGPDGKLYVTSGDRMRFDPAQDTASNVGKIVRINPDGTLPQDNPMATRGAAGGDVWSMGHRNPLGIAFEPTTRRLWIHEMGPLGGDEVNVVERGRNYGWPKVSNGDNYDGSHIPEHATDTTFVEPVHAWTPVVSPSGLIFYTGDRFRAWRNSLLFGGLSSRSLIRLHFRDGRPAVEERLHLGKRVRDVVQAPDGSIVLITDGKRAELLRLVPGSGAAR